MQQIATSEKSIAASALPISLGSETASGTSKSMNKAVDAAASVEKNTVVTDEGGNGSFKSALSEAQDAQGREPKKSEQSPSTGSRQATSEEAQGDSQDIAQSKDKTDSDVAKVTAKQQQSDLEPAQAMADKPAESATGAPVSTDDIDWVTFVDDVVQNIRALASDNGAAADEAETITAVAVDGKSTAQHNKSQKSVIAVNFANYTEAMGDAAIEATQITQITGASEDDSGSAIDDPLARIASDIVALLQSAKKTQGHNADVAGALANTDLQTEELEVDLELVKRLLSKDVIQGEPAKAVPEVPSTPDTTTVKSIVIGDRVETDIDALADGELLGVQLQGTPVEKPKFVSIGLPPVQVKGEPEKSTKVLALNTDEAEAVIEHIVSLVPDAEKAQGLATALRADINVAAAELSAQKQSNREPGIDLKRIVDKALSNAESFSPDISLAISEQAGRAEILMSLVQTAVEQANSMQANGAAGQTANLAAGLPQSNTLVSNEHALISAVEKLSSEGAVQVAEQNKSQAASLGAPDKAIAIHQPEGQKQMAEKIRWMVGTRVASADIRLDPPELGSMQIRVTMNGDTASVSFVVNNAQARDMLADAQPRLRDMLSEQGIDLGESFVATQDQQQSGEQGEGEERASGSWGEHEMEDEVVVTEQPLRSAQSPYNVDAYV